MTSIRALSLLALSLAPSATLTRPATASAPLWAPMTALAQASPLDGTDADGPDSAPFLGDDARLRDLLDDAVKVAQLTAPAPATTPRPTYAAPRYVLPNAAATYWNGQPAQAAAAQPTYYAQQPAAPAATYAQPAAAAAQPAASYGDPYGFTSWLNGVRAQYGLSPVAYDANLSAWANANNASQNSYGLGHHVMGPARRQNSAMGSFANIGSQWLASPAHAAALLDPSIRVIGIAGMGAYWTFNAY